MGRQQDSFFNRIISSIRNKYEYNTDVNVLRGTAPAGDNLLAAAQLYINAAQEQEQTRNMAVIYKMRHAIADSVKRHGTGYRARTPTGGFDNGYKAFGKPKDWPLDRAWTANNPRQALISAAALIIEELQRLEETDNELIGNVPKKKDPVNRILVNELNDLTGLTPIQVSASNVVWSSSGNGMVQVTLSGGGSGGGSGQANTLVQQP